MFIWCYGSNVPPKVHVLETEPPKSDVSGIWGEAFRIRCGHKDETLKMVSLPPHRALSTALWGSRSSALDASAWLLDSVSTTMSSTNPILYKSPHPCYPVMATENEPRQGSNSILEWATDFSLNFHVAA